MVWDLEMVNNKAEAGQTPESSPRQRGEKSKVSPFHQKKRDLLEARARDEQMFHGHVF
jgi:hypothetical protein